MSSYLRSIPNKFTSFVNTRKQVTNIDYQLSKHLKSSLFLHEFLGTETATKSTINSKEKPLNSIVPLLNQNISTAFIDASTERPKTLSKKYNCTKHRIVRLYQQRQINVESLNVITSDLTNMNLLKNNSQWRKSLTNLKNKRSNFSHIETISVKRMPDNILLNSERESILYSEISPQMQNMNEAQKSEDEESRESRLQNIFNILSKNLPNMFIAKMNYSIYTSDLIFVNNIKGVTTVGIYPYIKQISLLKVIGHLKYAYITLNILKITMHPEDNSIKVRWRIIGVSSIHIFFKFLKFNKWSIKEEEAEDKSAWYDGFSTFYVNNEGKIFKHVADKMMPNQDIEEKVKTPIEPKLALFDGSVGLDSHYFVKFCLKKYPQLL